VRRQSRQHPQTVENGEQKHNQKGGRDEKRRRESTKTLNDQIFGAKAGCKSQTQKREQCQPKQSKERKVERSAITAAVLKRKHCVHKGPNTQEEQRFVESVRQQMKEGQMVKTRCGKKDQRNLGQR